MARFNLSFLAVFLVLAALAMSLPTKRNEQGSALDTTADSMESAPKMMEGLDTRDTTKTNQASTEASAMGDEKKDDGDKKPTQTGGPSRTQKKPTSGKFATPTPTHTSKASSKPNALGKLPIVGGLLGGTGGSL
ncbi:hypothetical protein NUU61_009735 [Penicillium alfredii]|uniref:Uncharacterized protein n=1 Tax=Penicillium alfredii TaxID=1506179 RepID=A0A9W9EGQ3_9EURO|nr:uncharacterized protein NUU61_009735 [Penicillium alfredii]KAJ5081471.1 hypothetical protein NUU61_009735 [Penicillium alfredii]